MKTKGVTTDSSFAWSKQALMLSKLEEVKGHIIATVSGITRLLGATYYEDAIKEAFIEYILEKRGVLDSSFKVIMTVMTKDDVDHPYTAFLPRECLVDVDTKVLAQDIIKPTAKRLALGVSREIPFSDVKSVSCYVEEVEVEE